MISGVSFGILLSAWSVMSANDVVIRLAYSLPMKLWILFLVINNTLCMLKQFSLSLSACALDNSKPAADQLRKKRNYVAAKTDAAADTIVPRLTARLRGPGWRTLPSRDGLALRAHRWRFAPMGTVIFHGAFFFLVLGVMISSLTRTEAQVVVATGDTFSTKQSDRLIEVKPPDSQSRLPDFGFTVKKVQASFWKDRLLFTDMRAKIVPTGTKREVNVLLNWAWKPDFATYVRLIGLGYAPHYRITDDRGREIEEAYVNLTAFPPGSEDSFNLESSLYQIYVKVFPNSRLIKNRIVNKDNNLRRVGYLVRVKLKNRFLLSRFLRPNDSLDFGRLHLSFPDITYWGQFNIVRNPGLLVVWLGCILGSIGLVWRLIFYRKDFTALVVRGSRSQTVHLHVRSDYYPHQARLDLENLAREIEQWPGRAPEQEGEEICR